MPQVKRYFDGPGQNIAPGPWNRVVVDLDTDTLYHVGARRLDDDQPTFHLFGREARDGCEVSPNAGTWLMGKADAAPFRVLPYLEGIDERGRGRLRFTTLDCEVQEIAVEDAGRPYPRLYDHGYLVPTGDGYTFVDPWRGEQREIAHALYATLVWNAAVLLWADGKLKSFNEQFVPQDELGSEVVTVVPVDDHYVMEDADGLHLVHFDHATLKLSSEDILPDGCRLQQSPLTSPNSPGHWLSLELPCGSGRPSLVHFDASTHEALAQIDIPLDIDARLTRAIVIRSSPETEPAVTLFYLTDTDSDGLGTLWAWQPELEQPLRLGERADLDAVLLEDASSSWSGLAHVNYQQLGGLIAHDLLHFRWDGSSELLAERTVRNGSTGELLVNFDGKAGDLPQFDEDSISIVAEDVPPYLGQASSFIGQRHNARIDHFDGVAGRALLGNDQQLFGSYQELAHGVPPESLRFTWFMPAVMFIENWDPEQSSGSLVAYNYELDARVTIAEGVSSYDLTSYPWDGVVYAVPHGSKRGVWFSKAK
ncbi:MAG TPA: hypothetical protein VIW29_12715 [Polyangiaceae bacterium]